MTPYTSHHTTINTIRLHHLAWQGDEPPVIYLPGFIANAYGALRLAAAISPTRRVLALDLRGRGDSDKPTSGYGISQHIADLKAWLDALGITRCVLAGHSFGASLALYFHQQYPTYAEKIILLDGGSPPSEQAFQLFWAYHHNLTYNYPSSEAYLAPYRQSPAMQPWTPEAEQLIRANITENADGSATRSVPPYVVQAELAQIDPQRWRELAQVYPQVRVPVLLIRAGWGSFGREDQHLSEPILATMQAGFPQFQVYDMPQAGHTSILTIPDSGRDAALRAFVS